MTVSRPDNEAIFHAARAIPDPDRRREYVRQACGGDETRIAQVEALLAAADAPDSLLDRPAASDPAATSDQPATETPGAVIGPYKLLEQIGEGGMGSVWMAQQTEPVKRLVAVKLIKTGMDSKQVIARFEAERQALALMDHPHIARVLDAGTTKGEPGGVSPGRPYFVMDLVKGVPITRYCDEHRLTPRQRLELFIPVCQAVQHAHHLAALKADSRNPDYRLFYRIHLGVLTGVHAGLLEQADAVRTAETCRNLGWDPPTDAYHAAYALSLCVPIVAQHAKLDDKQRKEAAQFYADAAMKLLREAVSKGYKDVAHIKKDTDLDPLRQRQDFQKLIAELEGKGK